MNDLQRRQELGVKILRGKPEPVAGACEPVGWTPVDLAGFRIADPKARTWLVFTDQVAGPYTRQEMANILRVDPLFRENKVVDQGLREAIGTAREWIGTADVAPAVVAVWPTGIGHHALRPLISGSAR